MTITEEASKALRAEFPPAAIGKLPKAGITLDYVGHATVTDRLLSVDPEWTWEPVSFAPDGGPMVRSAGKELTLWIRLTVCGVTRLGVGSVAPTAFDVEKQLVGDAIRNAAMRFGVALDLWSKAELESTVIDEAAAKAARKAPTVPCPESSCTLRFASKAEAVPHLVTAHGWTEDGGKVHPPSAPSSTDAGPPATDDDVRTTSAGSGVPTGGGEAGVPQRRADPPPASGASNPSPESGASHAQMRKLHAAIRSGMGRAPTDPERHMWASAILDREVVSFNSLTKVEAGTLIERAEAGDAPAPAML